MNTSPGAQPEIPGAAADPSDSVSPISAPDPVDADAFDAVVVAGGPRPAGAELPAVPPIGPDTLVVAADGGWTLAEHLGLVPSVVVGDLDSIAPDALDSARELGVEVVEHPTDKDATDTELALEFALARGARRVVLIGTTGGRLDHLLGLVAVLGAPRFQGIQLEARLDGHRVLVAHDRLSVSGGVGEQVSLLAWNGPAVVSTGGLRWPLTRHLVSVGSSLGVSNEFAREVAVVEVHSGCVLVVVPAPETRPDHDGGVL